MKFERFACDWKNVRLDFLITLGLEFFFFLNLCHFLRGCENAYKLRFDTLDLLNLGFSDKYQQGLKQFERCWSVEMVLQGNSE